MASDPPPKRIAIVGGGISALLTAFELTATEELRRRHQVTIYQMGWRLGGKLASGANPEPGRGMRNEEHGLHVWFGFYDNAFNDIAKCYTELLRVQPQFKYKSCFDAFTPNDYTPVGHRAPGGGYGWWPVHWPKRKGTPGQYDEDHPYSTPLALLREMLRWLRDFIGSEAGLMNFVTPDLDKLLASRVLPAVHTAGGDRSGAGIDHAIRWLERMENVQPLTTSPDATDLADYLKELKGHLTNRLRLLGLSDPDQHPIRSMIELVLTIIAGLLNPKYGWLIDFNLNRIDHLDYRAWLIENGGDPDIVERSSILRALYDIPFAYENGDISRPNFAAGAALRWTIRTAFTYRGHAMYVPQCGFGEAVIAPYYEVLKARGVRCKFFHKLVSTGLTEGKDTVQSLTFAIQAETVSGDDYDPVTFSDGLYHWPIQPDWDQLKNGGAYAAKGVDFESHWNSEPHVGHLTVQKDCDFDHVVIALAGAVWKRLNDVDAPPVAAMLDARPCFKKAADTLGIVATAGVQFWMNKTTRELGWAEAPATVGGPEPLDVWADMSQVLAVEKWPDHGPAPKSLHYLCGPIDTKLFEQPSTNAAVPAHAQAAVVKLTQDWIARYGTTNWPGAAAASGAFDYRVLFDPSKPGGDVTLGAQYLRANISPTECCGNSFAGTTRHRISADDLLFSNASIVGADTNTGINVTCVEGATISARKASRKICGSPRVIPGENFMAGPFP